KTRSNKKDTICKYCSYEYSIPQKLHKYLKQKNLYKPLQDQKN
ncbi:739_t:CDS:1, partial [Racocetra persica]